MNAKRQTVSIIMNCFNGERYLRQALDSVIAQTYKDWELIFWDNLSSDNSLSIAKSYRDPRINVFLAEQHTTLYAARNLAFEKTTGTFVAFLDTDDFWEPDKLLSQVPMFGDPKMGLGYGKYWLLDEINQETTLAPPHKLRSGNILPMLLERNDVGILTMIVRREVLRDLIGPFDSRYEIIGDTDLVFRIAEKWELKAINQPVATYRWHHSNDTKTKPVRLAEEWAEWLVKSQPNQSFVESPGFKARRKMIYKEIARCIAFQGSFSPFRKLQSGLRTNIEKLISPVIVSFYAIAFFCGKQFSGSRK